MFKPIVLAVAAAGIITIAPSAPASANAAAAGTQLGTDVGRSAVVDVRRGRRGGWRRGGWKRGGLRLRSYGGGHRYRSFRRGHRFRSGRRWRRRGIYFASPYVYYRSYNYGNCRWLRRKARRTGSRYWWRRYYRCRDRYYY